MTMYSTKSSHRIWFPGKLLGQLTPGTAKFKVAKEFELPSSEVSFIEGKTESYINDVKEQVIREFRNKIMDEGWDLGGQTQYRLAKYVEDKIRISVKVQGNFTFEELLKEVGGRPPL